MTLKLILEYDGSGFSGWSAQEGLRSVEGVLSGAIETVLRREVELSVAGRTDAGVHAWGQVASFRNASDLDPDRFLRSLNGVLPADVVVRSAERADDGFDARKDALARTYCYRVLARPAPSPFELGRALWWPRRLDEEALAACAGALLGIHDFTAFTPTETEHVRFRRDVMRAEWVRKGDLLEFWIEADTFMRHMVRVLVGTMLEVGGGRRSKDDFTRLLQGAPRPEAGPTAEPHGLYLASVRY